MEELLKKRLKNAKEEYKINYTFIANKIGVTRQHLYRWTLPNDNKEHRNLSSKRIAMLDDILTKIETL